MAGARVRTFFYGSFINRDVLAKSGCALAEFEVARLGGFDIQIQPLANLVHSPEHSVYGIVAPTTHDELRRLYDYAQTKLGGTYLPEAVIVEKLDGNWRPALCYIAPTLDPRPAANDYIDRIVEPAREYGFPEWYMARLESYRP